MEKFLSSKHEELIGSLPFSYFSTNLYLDFSAYILERNGEQIIVWQDEIYPHEFPAIFLPRNKENWLHTSTTFVTLKDVEKLNNENIEIIINKPTGTEFFYNSADFINPTGELKTKINRFKDNYAFEIKNKYSKDKILEFYNFWKDQRIHESITFGESEEFFMYCLDNLDKYNIKQVYVESEGKLIGLAFGMIHTKGGWVGLHLKVDYSYKGLSRFLHHERSKLFSDRLEFTLGTDAHDVGIGNYKEELGPKHKEVYFYVLTGDKMKK